MGLHNNGVSNKNQSLERRFFYTRLLKIGSSKFDSDYVAQPEHGTPIYVWG